MEGVIRDKGMVMAPTDSSDLTRPELDAIAWRFLRSEFSTQTYADWPIDRRLDAFLLHHGPTALRDDGSAYSDLLDHVMANIGPAQRRGVLPS